MPRTVSIASAVSTEPDGAPEHSPLIAMIGARLGFLAALRAAPEVQEFPRAGAVSGRHRAVVIGVDVAASRTRHQLRAVLRDVEVQCSVLVSRLHRLEHILVVLNGSILPERIVLRICDGAAGRIHAYLEQACARSIVLTVLLAGECDDHGSLAERLMARARQRACLDAGIALRWRDIVSQPIGAVGANTYV